MKHFQTFTPAEAPVVEDVAAAGRFSLRARPASAAALGAALGLDLPSRIGERAHDGEREVACLGPGEWLIVAPEVERDTIADAFRALYEATPHALTDISDRELSYRIAGPGALAILAMGCPRDVAAIAPDHAVRTIFHGASVILWRDGEDSLRVDIWRSFAPHVRGLMAVGCRELAIGV